MKLKLFMLIYIVLSLSSSIMAQSFQRTFGLEGDDVGSSILKFSDSYVISGFTDSDGEGDLDLLMMEIDSQGTPIWTKKYGTTIDDFLRTTIKTIDGGFVSIGETGENILVLKTDRMGNVLWSKSIGGGNSERGFSILQNTDGSFVLIGDTHSYGAGLRDLLVVKITENGELIWSKTYGNQLDEASTDFTMTDDNAFVIVGVETSLAQGFGILALKIDQDGNPIWTRSLDGSGNDHIDAIYANSDGDFVLYGHTLSCSSDYNNIAIKINDTGETTWSYTYGEGLDDKGISITKTPQDAYLLSSYFVNTIQNDKIDLEIIEINDNGIVLNNKIYGGQENDRPFWGPSNGITTWGNNGFVLPIYTESYGQGGKDIQIIQDDFATNLDCNIKSINTFETPCSLNNSAITLQVIEVNVSISNLFLDGEDINLLETEICCNITAEINGKTTICKGENAALSASGGQLYVWSPAQSLDNSNSANPTASPSITTIYHVTVSTENECTGTASTEVVVNPRPSFNIIPPSILCEGESTELSFGNQTFAAYLWEDGSMNSTLEVNEGGFYSVTITDENGCTANTVTEVIVHSLPAPNLPSTMNICEGETIELALQNQTFDNYLWEDGSSNPALTISESGTYSLTVTDTNDCTGVGNTEVIEFSAEPPVFDLGVDVLTICQDSTVVLQIEEGFDSYLWSDGSTQNFLTIVEAGNYKVTVSNSCNSVFVSAIDSITVITEDCSEGEEEEPDSDNPQKIVVPSAFSPNEDGINDAMRIWHTKDIEIVEFSIYNRFGNLVFTTDNSIEGWNGIYKNQLQDIGVYAYYIQAIDNEGNTILKQGNFTLIR